MKKNKAASRCKFLKQFSLSATVLVTGRSLCAEDAGRQSFSILQGNGGPGPDDQVNLSLIGAGGMGTQDAIITAIRNNGNVAEDDTFGYLARTPALLCNASDYQNAPMFRDREKMQLLKK